MSHDTTVAVKPPYSNSRRTQQPDPGCGVETKEGHEPGPRVKTTIRIRKRLWEEFMASTHSKGLSTCHVLEALLSAWLYGGALVPGLGQPLQLNLTMQHIVARPRRMEPEPAVSEKEWDDWVRYYEDTWLFTPVKVGPRRYRLYPV